jgi:hypothetical protein
VVRHAVARERWFRASAWLLTAILLAFGLGEPIGAEGRAQQNAYGGLIVAGHAGLAERGGLANYTLHLLNESDLPLAGSLVQYTLPVGFTYVAGSTRVSTGGQLLSSADPTLVDSTLGWGTFQLPAAGHTAHTPRGIHTVVQDLCLPEFLELHLDQARSLVGSGGYVTQMFYRITATTTAPDACAIAFVNAAYDRNLVPILRLQGILNPAGYWERPDPGPAGDYAPVAAGFARYVAGLPRRDSHPLYIAVWNEPNLWIEWSNAPNAIEYARFFVAVSKAIRSLNDPRIRILNGAVAPGDWDNAARFIRTMLTVPDFVNAFDAWASHCYPYNHPPAYNLHDGTARYGNTAIDCYLQERDLIQQHGGRSGFKFVLTETGYELGNRTYGFEGFPRIDETNRAAYMQEAFSRYWPAWPEVIAVTPFLLGDPWNGWERFDWITYAVSLNPPQLTYTLRPQYTAVAALSQTRGQTVPHGLQITFQARVGTGVALGAHTGRLCGQAADRSPRCTDVVARVVERVSRTYLPTVSKSVPYNRDQGVWYLGGSGDAGPADDGAIRPTAFLRNSDGVGGQAISPRATAARIAVPGFPQVAIRCSGGVPGCLYIGTRTGDLVVVDMMARREMNRIPLSFIPRALAAGPSPDSVYVASETGDIQLIVGWNDAPMGRQTITGRQVRAMVFDADSNTLLAADAGAGAILRFSADLSERLAVESLPDLPDQVFLDRQRRRLLVVLPGAGRVTALDAGTLQPFQDADLPGGPVLAAAVDQDQGRLYALTAVSPRQRLLVVLDLADLSSIALVAGTLDVPLQRATALDAAGGRLWIVEGDRLYAIGAGGFEAHTRAIIESSGGTATPVADPTSGDVVWVDEGGVWIPDRP